MGKETSNGMIEMVDTQKFKNSLAEEGILENPDDVIVEENGKVCPECGSGMDSEERVNEIDNVKERVHRCSDGHEQTTIIENIGRV